MKQYFRLLFPTKELLVAYDGLTAREGAGAAHALATRLSEHYNCNVSFVEPNTCVVLLEVDEDERCYKLLDSNGNIGWIYCCDDFSKYFDPVKE
jgi:hypothetical protein